MRVRCILPDMLPVRNESSLGDERESAHRSYHQGQHLFANKRAVFDSRGDTIQAHDAAISRTKASLQRLAWKELSVESQST